MKLPDIEYFDGGETRTKFKRLSKSERKTHTSTKNACTIINRKRIRVESQKLVCKREIDKHEETMYLSACTYAQFTDYDYTK